MDSSYSDDDLVYIDPDARKVVGIVELTADGVPQKMQMPDNPKDVVDEDDGAKRRPRRKRYYPWGTYRSMKKQFRLEGKEKETDSYKELDEAMQLSSEQPFWD